MKEYLVFSIIGTDRTGLVDRITEAVYRAEGNLEDSRMAILGGEFAIIMLCSVDEGKTVGLEKSVRDVADSLGLLVIARKTTSRHAQEGTVPLTVHVKGMDHEGIVHEIAHHLAGQGISVELLETRVTNAPYSGTPLLSMDMKIAAPASLSLTALRKSLGQVADRLNVDIEVK